MATISEGSALPGINISWRQLAAIAGIAGVALFVIGAAMQGDAPMADEAAADVRQWYDDNGSTFLLGNVLISLGVILGLVPFFTYLRGVLAAGEGGDATWSRINYLGAVLFVLIGGIGGGLQSALATDAAALEDDSVILALQYMCWGLFSMVPLAMAPFFLGLAFVSLRTGVFASWMAWLSLLLAALAVVSIFGTLDLTKFSVFTVLGYISTIGLGVVVLITSVVLLRRTD